MGCDIHAMFQAKSGNGKWIDIESKYEQNRHYFLFAWLAGVRNGFGFAGIPTHDPIKPISKPRGYPSDFAVEGDDHPTTVPDEWRDEPYKWMGDHSHSWLTGAEILAAPRPEAGARRTGVVTIGAFRAWDGKTPPAMYSGGISGPGIKVAASPLTIEPDTTHVQIEWDMEPELDYFVDEIRRLVEKYGEIRMVFGFDS